MNNYFLSISVFLFNVLVLSSTYGQTNVLPKTWAIGLSSGYQHQQVSMAKLGLWALKDLSYAEYLRFDGGVNFAFFQNETHYIPELGVAYYISAKGIWPSVKAELTPYTVTPKVAVGVFNFLEFGVGYGLKIQDKKGLPSIDGLNISIGLSIPFNYYIK